MWLIFAGDWARWLAGIGAAVLVIGVALMPRSERARFFRTMAQRRRRSGASASAVLGSRARTGDTPVAYDASGDDPDLPPVPARLPRGLEGFSSAARMLVVVVGFAVLALIAWMVIALMTSLPGWS